MSAPFAPRIIRPQPGPQEMFLASPADIVIYGGGAGGGKTWGLLLEPLRHVNNPGFGAVFFRKNSTQIRNEGGLWDESMDIYQPAGGTPKESVLDWNFPSGASISFRHLEHEKTKFDWQGSQIPLLCFDELTHFTDSQFWYMISRNRSMCGVRPYVRATCNPDPDSWVAELISWWIDPETGYPIKERAGVVRYFVRLGDNIKWADHPDDLARYTMLDADGYEIPIPPKSLTFIPALLTDNKALLANNPEYMANLMAQGTVQRERLMNGNWKVKSTDGLFKNHKITIIDEKDLPKLSVKVRGWDLAATEVTAEGNLKTAYTAGVKMARTLDKRFVILDVKRDRVGPFAVRTLIKNTAADDGRLVYGSMPQDPGQAGKSQVADFIAMLAGYKYTSSPESGDKITRAEPFAAQCEAGNVMLLRGPWNKAFIDELEAFPSSNIKDQVDAAGRAFNFLTTASSFRIAL